MGATTSQKHRRKQQRHRDQGHMVPGGVASHCRQPSAEQDTDAVVSRCDVCDSAQVAGAQAGDTSPPPPLDSPFEMGRQIRLRLLVGQRHWTMLCRC